MASPVVVWGFLGFNMASRIAYECGFRGKVNTIPG